MNADSYAAAPPARTTVSSGRRRRAAAASAARSGKWRRSSPAGVRSAPSRTAAVRVERIRRLRATGSSSSELPPTTSQPALSADSSRRRRCRREPARTAMRRCGVVRASRRGHVAASVETSGRSSPAISASSSGSARWIWPSRPASTPSTSTVAGAAVWAIRRHRPPTWPRRAAEVVAEPKSRAKNARGWLVTWLCYPARSSLSPIRRPRRSPRRGPAVAR